MCEEWLCTVAVRSIITTLMKTHYSLLDGVRFLAAFWVMNFHYLFGGSSESEVHWYRYGNLGVQLFFIISGFVIVHSLHGKTLKEFAVGRFIRLFPLFWILCTFTYVIMLLLPDAKYTFFVVDYLRSMTMLNDVLNGFLGPATLIDPSYWTLTVELIFYAEIALFVHFFSYNRIRYFLLSWLLLSMCAFVAQIDENFYIKLLLVRHAAYFIFGSALALIARKDATTQFERSFDWLLLFVSAAYATYIVPHSLPAYSSPHALDIPIVTLLNVVFFLSVPLCVYLSGYVTSTRFLEFLAVLGGLTYPLYLLHQRAGNAFMNLATATFDISWYLIVIYFEILIIACAYGVYVYDKKLRKWLQTKRHNKSL